MDDVPGMTGTEWLIVVVFTAPMWITVGLVMLVVLITLAGEATARRRRRALRRVERFERLCST